MNKSISGSNRGILLKILFIIALSIFILSSLALSYSYTLKPVSTHKENVRYAELDITPNSRIYVKPALIYDYRNYIDSNEAVLSLSNKININISYNQIIYNNTELGKVTNYTIKYRIYGVINVGEWSKSRVIVKQKNVYKQSFKEVLFINISDIKSIVERISSETGVSVFIYRYIINIEILNIVRYSSGKLKEYSLTPKITFTFASEKNKLSITYSGLSKNYIADKTFTVQNTVYGKYTVYEFRKITLFATVISGSIALLALATIIRNRPSHGGKLEYYIKRYKPLVIKGFREKDHGKVMVRDLEEIFRIAKTYNVPVIIDDRNCLHTIIDGVTYIYCIKDKNSDEIEDPINHQDSLSP